jgi:hypothetical protein
MQGCVELVRLGTNIHTTHVADGAPQTLLNVQQLYGNAMVYHDALSGLDIYSVRLLALSLASAHILTIHGPHGCTQALSVVCACCLSLSVVAAI